MNLAVASGPLDLSAAAVAQRLLAYLLLRRHDPLTRKHVAFTLWPDELEAGALARLRRHVYLLHHLLPAQANDRPWILADRVSIQWNPDCDCWLDVEEFETRCATLPGGSSERAAMGGIPVLERAVALYIGDLLSDWYDDWVLAERERLWRIYGEALARLVSLRAATGDLHGALATAKQLVAHDRLLEGAHRLLIALQYLAGDRAAALAAFDECRHVLEAELDVAPMPETAQLAQAIRESRGAGQILGLVRRDFATDVTPETLTGRQLPSNLRCPITRFIGREQAVAEVTSLVRTNRLITLTGAAGCGKTRLAFEVAAGLVHVGDGRIGGANGAPAGGDAASFGDGVWWVDLAPIQDPGLVPRAVADVLGIDEVPGQAPLESIERAVRTKSLLLLLDNVEHVTDTCASLVERVLGAGAGVHVMATSRQPLGMIGEMTWLVPPLTVPPESDGCDRAELLSHEAPRLFLDRARLCNPAFQMVEGEIPAVACLSRLLDGIPLAVELAAVQVRTMSVRQIAGDMDDRFALLVHQGRDTTAHHSTLQAAIDWSHEQLTEPERVLFRRLAVFRGGWTLEAAEAVCCGDDLAAAFVAVVLANLVTRSLVAVGDYQGRRRYRILETLRQYADDRLAESGEANVVRAQHLRFFLALAETAEPHLRTGDQGQWLDRLETDHHNLRAALDSPAADMELAEAQLRLAASLLWFWIARGHVREGLDRLLTALDRHQAQDMPRQKALQAGAILADILGDYGCARSLSEENLAAAEQSGNKTGLAASLGLLGNLAIREGDFGRARDRLAASIGILRELDNREGVAAGLNNLAILEAESGQFASARAHAEESLALSRAMADTKGAVPTLQALGEMAIQMGDRRRAKDYFEECLDLARGIGYDYAVAVVLGDLGYLALADGDQDLAHGLLEESLSLHRAASDLEGEAVTLARLGEVELARGETGLARSLCVESLRIAWSLGDIRQVVASLESLASVDLAIGHRERAAVLYGATKRQREAMGAAPDASHPVERGLEGITAGDHQERRGEVDWAAATARGRAMPLDRAVALCLSPLAGER